MYRNAEKKIFFKRRNESLKSHGQKLTCNATRVPYYSRLSIVSQCELAWIWPSTLVAAAFVTKTLGECTIYC